jgi:hypothetical protein
MTRAEVLELDNGDEVYWRDPDPETSCSRIIEIRDIKINGEVVCIWGIDGSYLECFAHELE